MHFISAFNGNKKATFGLPFGSSFNIYGIMEQDKKSILKVDTGDLLQKWQDLLR